MTRNILTFICLMFALCTRVQNIYFNHLTPADGLSQISVITHSQPMVIQKA